MNLDDRPSGDTPFFEDILDELPLIVWAHAADGTLEFVNCRYREVFGVSEADLDGNGWQRLLHPDDSEFLEQFARAQDCRGSFRGEARARLANGEWRLFESYARPRFNTDGTFLGLVGTSVDITDRVGEQRQSDELQHRFESALQSGQLGEWLLDVRSGRIERNARHDRIMGYTDAPADWTIHIFLEHVHPDDRAHVATGYALSIERGLDWDWEARVIHPDGSLCWVWVRGGIIASDDEGPVRMSGVIRDISQRRRHEDGTQLLADTAAPLAMLVDHRSTLQSIANLTVPYLGDWCVIDMFPPQASVERAAGAHRRPALGILLERLSLNYAPDGDSLAGQACSTGSTRFANRLDDDNRDRLVCDAAHRRVLGQLQPTAQLSVPMMVRGRCLGVINHFMSDRRRRFAADDIALAEQIAQRVGVAIDNAALYESLRESDRMKEVYLAMIAHELRNPLGAISNGLELLLAQPHDDDQRDTLAMMDRQRLQLTRLLDDLLDVSRISRGTLVIERKPTALAPVIASAVSTVKVPADNRRQSIELHADDTDLAVKADAARLEQIVGNLMMNAVKYTQVGGRIEVVTRREGAFARIEVIDNGIGIAAEQTAAIFEQFSQVRQSGATTDSGLGIGLALVRELARLHDGSVTVHSDGPGCGSRFVVQIPLAERARVVTPADVPRGQADAAASCDILVVDDNQDSVTALKTLLELRGHRVRVAYDGRSALACVIAQRPALIILDIGLPDISGYDVAERVRALDGGEGIRLVALTGYGQPRDRERSLVSGFDVHLVKPVKLRMIDTLFDPQ